MPNKNDISALLKQNSNSTKNSILPQKIAHTEEVQSTPQKMGRPKKEPSEKRNFKVMLSLTEDEGRIIEEKSGLASNATYVYAFLVDHGFFK